MSAKVCCHCHKPITNDGKWEASISSKTVADRKTFIVHEHYRCAVEADRVQLGRALEAIAEAERSGIS